MAKSLPARPDLDQLKKQAKELLKSRQSNEPEAIRRFAEHHSQSASNSSLTPVKLSDAQLVIAREYGFAGWPRLKEQVESQLLETAEPHEQFKHAFEKNDAPLFRKLMVRHPALKAKLNEPIGPFDSPAINHARSREMLDALLEAGADINARSRWWAGGFGLLDSAEPELAAYAIQRGAIVDAHAAARLGLFEKLCELIAADPTLVNAPGGDGQTPLHFAKTIQIADFLLDHGADIDRRDVDHESTPAQYMVRDRPEVARRLVERGCRTDLLMASALGNATLVRKHLDAEPNCIRMRVSNEYFPMINRKSGGTIYQWTLGWHVSAHDLAKEFGHAEIRQLLLERSPEDLKLVAAGWAGDDVMIQELLARNPALASSLNESDRRQIAHAARNNNTAAVRAMLKAGWPTDARGQHHATPLHWAAFHGNAEMAREILRHQPPLEVTDADFKSTPLGWAIHGSEHGWYCRTGDYAGIVEALLNAGATMGDRKLAGSEAVQEVLHQHGVKE